MKLIFCTECEDVIRLTSAHRTCLCGKSTGYYTDTLYAEIFGPCIPLGFHNRSFVEALRLQPETGEGIRFTAFVIPKYVPTIKRI